MPTQVIPMTGEPVAVAGPGKVTVTLDHTGKWFTAKGLKAEAPARMHSLESWKDREFGVPAGENLYLVNPQGSFAVVTAENEPEGEAEKPKPAARKPRAKK